MINCIHCKFDHAHTCDFSSPLQGSWYSCFQACSRSNEKVAISKAAGLALGFAAGQTAGAIANFVDKVICNPLCTGLILGAVKSALVRLANLVLCICLLDALI